MEGKELVKEWCKERYPMMATDDDYAELDCYDMFEFADWLFLKLNKAHVISSVCDHPEEALIRDKPTPYCLACNKNIPK